jgi:D-xylonolactonase
MNQQCRLVWPLEAELGEGPIWIPREQALWFVDIKQGMLHRYHPASDDRRSLAVGGQPSFIVPVDGGSLLVGNLDALRLLENDRLGSPIARVDMPSHNRTNDGCVDPAGRLWFGTMDDDHRRPTGAVYMFDGNELTRVGGECMITNGPAVSADGDTLYHVDTVGRAIWRFDISAGPELGNGELFVRIEPQDGAPDGVTLDSDGCLWVALWGGWQVRRYAPDGELLATISVPSAQVTKVAFGGKDLTTGYVTTARIGLGESELAKQPLAGGLFAFDAPAPGVAAADVRLK